VYADESESADAELDQPLCRRNQEPLAAPGWQLGVHVSTLSKVVRRLQLPSYMSRNTAEYQTAFPWSNGSEFRFDGDLNEWHRLRVYGSRDAVRVITLWNSDNLTLALQTDKHGDPMLRWTSKELSRGEASRGLLDRWIGPRDVD
jgi:hypothetical protein